MSIIREFLVSIGYDTSMLSNQHLGLTKQRHPKKQAHVNQISLEQAESPIARVLLGLQIHFGLTFSEAMRLMPAIHIQEQQLWLTREMTFNNEDRFVPFHTTEQKEVLSVLTEITNPHQSLIESYGYDAVRFAWRDALRVLMLPPRKAYRYVYAQARQKALITTLNHYKTTLTIMDEMGLKSRTTLWGYLRE